MLSNCFRFGLYSLVVFSTKNVRSVQIDCTPDGKVNQFVDGPVNIFIDTVKEELNATNKYILKSYPVC